MSSDLLAEFDSFYSSAPSRNKQTTIPPSNDLAFLSKPSPAQASEYGDTTQKQARGKEPVDDIWDSMSNFQSSAPVQQAASQDDIWGSFEAPVPPKQTSASIAPTKQANYGGWGATSVNRPSGLRRGTVDLFNNNMSESPPTNDTKPAYVPPPRPAPVRNQSYGGDILFDADEATSEAEDDDDFGDFETVAEPDPPSQPQPLPSQSLNVMFGATTLKPQPSKRPKDLLPTSSGMLVSNLPYPEAPKSPSFQDRNPYREQAPTLATHRVSGMKNDNKPDTASPVTAWPTFVPPKPEGSRDLPAASNGLDDEWGDFADLPPETPAVAVTSSRPNTGIEADAWGWDAADGVIATPPVTEAPPSNIPPPSIILTLFPALFDLPQSTLFKATANQPFSLKNRILSDPSTVDFLRAYLLIATVAARILAGRKFRWKRDTVLSQAMKIGPSAAGGKGGMKLAGIDKSEVAREDREAAEVLRVWKEQLGRLRSAVAVANTSLRDASVHLVIPEIAVAMHVKAQEGALTAPKQCLICGLKREERIAKVDVVVEDSFGEWWVEHWGHRACRNFWQEHEILLR